MRNNKKGQLGHGITWLWKFLLLVIVLGGVVAVVVSHYSKQLDVRDAEAYILSEKIVKCLAPNGIISETILKNETLKNCLPIDENELYINITMDQNNLEIGKPFLATLCKAKEQKVAIKFYPACLESKYHLLKQTTLESSTLEMLIAIRKIEKNL